MIFKSRQVNLDPLAEMCHCGTDVANHGPLDNHSPVKVQRPEFEPTRDPEPWKNVHNGGQLPNTESLARLWRNGEGNRTHWVWAPRREQFDTPVNRVLEAFRAVGDADAEAWAYCLSLAYTGESWPVIDHWDALEDAVEQIGKGGMDEIDHARRVLQRLANWKEQ